MLCTLVSRMHVGALALIALTSVLGALAGGRPVWIGGPPAHGADWQLAVGVAFGLR